jgi:p-aminobenzoyl-glutamate transporter AbgT
LPQNGNVLLVPNGAANAVEYNPYTGALVNTYNTGTGFSGACIHHTGEVVLCSFGNTNHKVLNINTNTVTNYAKLAGSFVGCVELPNRKVLMISFNAANFQIITHEVPTNPTAINTEVLKSIYLNKGL